jgi:hypothetical protein
VSGEHQPEQLRRFERELRDDPELCDRIFAEFAGADEEERIIKTSPQNADRAIARAIARAVELGGVWRIEIEE